MKTVLIFLMAVFATSATAIEMTHQTVEVAVAKEVGVPASALNTISSLTGGPRPETIAAVVSRRDGSEQLSRIVVFRVEANGALSPMATSTEFNVTDPSGRTNFERPEVGGQNEVRIQINIRTACGVHAYWYHFKKTDPEWRLIGFDAMESTCGEDGSVQLGREVSINHLTGKILKTDYKNDKPLVRTTKFRRFSRVTFKNFNPFAPETGYQQ